MTMTTMSIKKHVFLLSIIFYRTGFPRLVLIYVFLHLPIFNHGDADTNDNNSDVMFVI